MEDHGRRLHLYTRELTQRLREAGYFLLAISGSPEEILDIFLKPLGFDKAFGRVLAVDNENHYTGERLSNPFEDKQRVLEAFLAQTSMNLERSVGVGDALSDVVSWRRLAPP